MASPAAEGDILARDGEATTSTAGDAGKDQADNQADHQADNRTDEQAPDCAGTPGGPAREDMCGVCDADPDNDCVQDCAGTWGGAASEDMCGVCDADPDNDCVQDCAGTWGGGASEDMCGVCDRDAANDCVQDCAQVWGGAAKRDMCGVCDANPNNDCVQDCAGTWGGSAVADCLGICDGAAVVDCAGACDGTAIEDCAGTCNGTATVDCAGSCGGSAVSDCLGVCGGSAAQDCAGTCGGSAELDCLGVCGGSATCDGDPCDEPGANAPLSAIGDETCYDFQVHASGGSGPFSAVAGESYQEFVYDVPWPADSVATRYGIDLAGATAPYTMFAFSQVTDDPHGTVRTNVTGTTLGTNASLIGVWAAGGCNVSMPADVGLTLPGTDKIMTMWHMVNTTGAPDAVASIVRVCTLPGESRQHEASITWLGTENLNGIVGMQAGEHTFSSTCINDSAGPISIIAMWPHMHALGTNMKSELQLSGESTWAPVFDEPFTFGSQRHHTLSPPIVLGPADTLRTSCTFFNDTGRNVSFGQSTQQEMCYQFAFSYPARALDNGVLSLIGATNTCWQFGE